MQRLRREVLRWRQVHRNEPLGRGRDGRLAGHPLPPGATPHDQGVRRVGDPLPRVTRENQDDQQFGDRSRSDELLVVRMPEGAGDPPVLQKIPRIIRGLELEIDLRITKRPGPDDPGRSDRDVDAARVLGPTPDLEATSRRDGVHVGLADLLTLLLRRQTHYPELLPSAVLPEARGLVDHPPSGRPSPVGSPAVVLAAHSVLLHVGKSGELKRQSTHQISSP